MIIIDLEHHVDADSMRCALFDVVRDWGRGAHGVIVNTINMTEYDMGAQRVFIQWVNANTRCILKVAVVSLNPTWHIVASAIAPKIKVPFRLFYDLDEAKRWVISASC